VPESVNVAPNSAGRRALVLGFVGGVAVVLIIGGALWFLVGPRVGAFGGPLGRALAGPTVLSAQERRGEEIYNANGHSWDHPDWELKRVVRLGGDEMTDMMRQMMAPPDAPKMQAFGDKLSNDEIDAVLAFIKTMWTPDEREVQAQITREECPVTRSGS